MERDSHVPFLGGAGDRSDDRRDPHPFVACFFVESRGCIHTDSGKILDGRNRERPTCGKNSTREGWVACDRDKRLK